MRSVTRALVLVVALFCLAPAVLAQDATPCAVTVSPPPSSPSAPPQPFSSITQALSWTNPTSATLTISGVCTETVYITERFSNITLTGLPGATVRGLTPLDNIFSIRGAQNVTLKNLHLTVAPDGAVWGVQFYRGATGVIDTCLVEGVPNVGVLVNQNSFIRIVNSTIENNGTGGVFVAETSSVRIGFHNMDNPLQPNVIRNNGGDGIRASRTAHVRALGNTISGNAGHGVNIYGSSSGDISGNDISGNGGSGIRVALGGSLNMGIDSGKTEFDVPNSTTTNNLGFGLECKLNGTVLGEIGTLNGAAGLKKFGKGCVHDLTP